ncbi:protein Wnt-6-like isoform X2 [Stegodyphus dumicola]|uniref:protein Wnt-6-like isoform X2 n=1 Tax=Stegodyphus dumicola TaxID=202533 RepID=UPI0015B07A47|nr:protein Wnt-6-like isoform X2 [Stegodyphus dumicola]
MAMGRHLVLDPGRICRKARRLRGKQALICKNEPEVVTAIAEGSKKGIHECQYQFRFRRWNCTQAKRSLKKVLSRDTRETGFVNAITAAGIIFSITQACSYGQLLDCSCERNTPPVPTSQPSAPQTQDSSDGRWDWGGCSDNIDFGYRKSKEFMDDRFRRRSDLKTLLLTHNYEAGRLAVKRYMKVVHKCHGMSGSCAVKSTWRKLPEFRDVGNNLKERFDGAAKVMPGNDGQGFIPEGATIKPPEKEDIVYTEESPNYCEPDKKTGSLGTKGRICNHTSIGVDGCELLCCGRGYESVRRTQSINCKCKFQYCCEVHCETCDKKHTFSRCL